ncbi:MAG: hypothetical protein QW203_07415, partial [Thermoplasmatales archaeon]
NFSAIKGLSVDLANIRFSSDQAGNNLLYAWLESAPQGTFTQGSSVSSYTSSNVWVNLGSNIIPANGSLNIYMQVLSNGTEFDGVYWGANPLWTSTYGQYDNGANVFNFYDNFVGTSLKSVWTVPSGSNYTVNNGFIATPSGGSTAAVYNPSIQETSSIIVEWNLNLSSTTFPGASTYFQLNRYTPNSNEHLLGVQGYDVFYNNGGNVTTETILSTGNQIFGIWNDGTTVTWYYPTSSGESSYTDTSATAETDYVSLGWVYSGTSYNFPTIYWVRTRFYPPNGTDPVLTSIQILFGGNYAAASIPVPDWKILKGKPYVTVSAKGISNGLSNIFNDGADFGPDTPGTLTSGIQEAVNYIFSQGGGKIQLLSGVFNLNVAYVQQIMATPNAHVIEIPGNPDSNPIITIEIDGVPTAMADYQKSYSPPSITPTNQKAGSIIFFNGYLNTQQVAGAAIFGSIPPTSANANNNNVNIILKNIAFMSLPPTVSTQWQPTMVQLDNFAGYELDNIAVSIYTETGAIPNIYSLVSNYSIGISVNPPHNGNGLAIMNNIYVIGYWQGIALTPLSGLVQHTKYSNVFIQYCYSGLNLGNVGNYPPILDKIDIEQCSYPVIFNNTNPIWLYNAKFQFQSAVPFDSGNNWDNAIAYFYSNSSANVYGEIEVYITDGGSPTNPLFGGNTQYLSTLIIHQITGMDSPVKYPITSMGSATAGTTAGSVQQVMQSYSPIQKIAFYFNGYENDTTTAQTITFLNAFSTFSAITTNTTGLTLTASLTELTITAPNTTTTYSGLVIVEGY